MARPRVFISSTFYDLRQIRLELDKFLESMGYEPIRNEKGDIPYGTQEKLQEYCYKEINHIDILISIIGSRFGTTSDGDKNFSISNMELKTAIDEGKHVFIFIEKNVMIEYATYLQNKDVEDIRYKYVDNKKIYEFIEHLHGLPKNNNIKDFETADEITSYLKEQFAGLMKQFLDDERRQREVNVIKDINNTAATLKTLVDYLTQTNQQKDDGIHFLITASHPIVEAVRKLFNIQFKFFIENKSDLVKLLNAYGYVQNSNPIKSEMWFDNLKAKKRVLVHKSLFDENEKLIERKNQEWDEAWIQIQPLQVDDDLPF